VAVSSTLDQEEMDFIGWTRTDESCAWKVENMWKEFRVVREMGVEWWEAGMCSGDFLADGNVVTLVRACEILSEHLPAYSLTFFKGCKICRRQFENFTGEKKSRVARS